MTSEVSFHRIHKSGEKILGVKAAGLPQRKNPLHPSVPFLTGSALGPFTPKNGKAEHAFSMIVRGGNSRYFQKEPKGVDFPEESQGKLSRCILAVSILGFG